MRRARRHGCGGTRDRAFGRAALFGPIFSTFTGRGSAGLRVGIVESLLLRGFEVVARSVGFERPPDRIVAEPVAEKQNPNRKRTEKRYVP